jgi:C1A family cysteine protease
LHAFGPVAVSVNADEDVWKYHTTGIIKSAACGTKIGHAVLAIGYGKDSDGDDFVTIKNSWGSDWGESGFVRVSLTKKFGVHGVCGVLTDGYYATAKEV